MIQQAYRAARLFLHILAGVFLLVLTGAIWNNKTNLVKATKQWWLGRTTHLLGIEVQIIGTPPQTVDGKGLLYVSNHISWIDIPLIGSLTQLNFLSKAEVRRWPLIGKLAQGTGTLFIQRGSGDADRVAKAMAEYLNEGRSVLFFPEGTTSDGRGVRRFHSKLFKATQYTQTTVCPIVVHYQIAGYSHNPVAFINDDEFHLHLWNLLRYRKIKAIVEFLPARSALCTLQEAFVRDLQQEMSVVVQQRQLDAVSTSIQWLDASIPAAQKDGAASF